MSILKRLFFGQEPEPDLADRASSLLGINPKTQSGGKVPGELVARVHHLCMLTGG